MGSLYRDKKVTLKQIQLYQNIYETKKEMCESELAEL